MQTLIQTPCPTLAKSLAFYTSLGFKVISENSPCIVSDGKVFIEINPDRSARAGFKLYKESWQPEITALKEILPLLETDTGALFADFSGVWIQLIEGELEYDVTPLEEAYSHLGNNAGMSFETIDVCRASEVYQILGFCVIDGTPESGSVTYKNENELEVSLMAPNGCPHLFFNPSFNYFNGGQNLKIIEKIRELGVPITEEITLFNSERIVDNVIIRDPGGFGFFVFND